MRCNELILVGLVAWTAYFAVPISASLPGGMLNSITNSEAKAQVSDNRRIGTTGTAQRGRQGRQGGVSAPEINGPAGLSVLALLGCIIMVFRSRHRRRQH